MPLRTDNVGLLDQTQEQSSSMGRGVYCCSRSMIKCLGRLHRCTYE